MIQAVTIDFWNTIVDSRNGASRRAVRHDAMKEVYEASGLPWNEAQVEEAFRVSYAAFEHVWQGEQRTPSASESLNVIWKHLGIDVPGEVHARAVRSFEDSILAGMPSLLPGAAEGIAALASRYRLAVISDTAYSPGRVLRKVLEAHGIAKHFTFLAYSDEVGVSKPHRKIFQRALSALDANPAASAHIGDIERTDIAGAKALGMRAVLFRGDESGRYYHENGEDRTAADAVAHHWAEIPRILSDFDTDQRLETR
ncbi:HAD family hydrolase [bacterium]|nr:HAD family hydrolase [bacterium]